LTVHVVAVGYTKEEFIHDGLWWTSSLELSVVLSGLKNFVCTFDYLFYKLYSMHPLPLHIL
jgi:hypothetical protein